MNIHEYQAKELLRRYGVAVPAGIPAMSVDEAVNAAEVLGGPVWVVKAQIHAGGRGKGGGVKVVRSAEEVHAEAGAMLGMNLVTHQTGPGGRQVRRLYIEEGCDIGRELYLSVLLDRATGRVMFMASTEGGVEIEEVAKETPEKIVRVSIDPATGMQPFHARYIAFSLGLDGGALKSGIKFFSCLYNAFTELDASLIEINPLVVTGSGEVMALDAKMSLDDNALFRQKEIAEMRDEDEEDEKERIAGNYGISYVSMSGNIGCMVNGAGLAMATMDIIKLHGGEPANFLDVGGGADKEKVAAAFKIILSDPGVKGILVNIFGGIMHCDLIAEGIVSAARETGLNVPVVVRLEGTNFEQGRQILEESGLQIIPADSFDAAARNIVEAVARFGSVGRDA
jgi:succinyl-CoA synthetase beta subunit